jgi:hypothetical protein
MRRSLVLVLLAACSSSKQPATPDAAGGGDATAGGDAATGGDAANGDAGAGFGVLSGMCGVLAVADLTGAQPEIVRDTFTFARGYMDPADRPLLTPGGQRLAATPNAGGSSGLSEIFAYEQLARCEGADLLHTETEIMYDGTGKITDMEVSIDGHKIGDSVTRAQTYPLGQTYTLDAATMLISRKLTDIQASSAHVSAQDHWDKQILSVLAYDGPTADTVAQAWAGLDASVKADTIIVVTQTDGDDTFIYTNN